MGNRKLEKSDSGQVVRKSQSPVAPIHLSSHPGANWRGGDPRLFDHLGSLLGRGNARWQFQDADVAEVNF